MKLISEELSPFITNGKIEVGYGEIATFKVALESMLAELNGGVVVETLTNDLYATPTPKRRGRPPGSGRKKKTSAASRKKRTTSRRRVTRRRPIRRTIR